MYYTLAMYGEHCIIELCNVQRKYTPTKVYKIVFNKGVTLFNNNYAATNIIGINEEYRIFHASSLF